MSEINKSWDPIWEKVFLESPWGKYPGESLIQFKNPHIGLYGHIRNQRDGVID